MFYNDRNVFIFGLSGAGKTSVTNVLEDLGYHCIDQLPKELYKELIATFDNDAFSYDKLAISSNLNDLDYLIRCFDNSNVKFSLILLDSSKEVLLKRYNQTKRVHPLVVNGVVDTLEEAIDIEKEMLTKYIDKVTIIDTSDLGTTQLKSVIEDILDIDKEEELTITFESFSYKHGVAKDADFVFDTRCLDNPYKQPDLKLLTGHDKDVIDYVLNNDNAKSYLNMIINILDYSIKTYVKDGKRHFTIAIGSTNGIHRSVVITNYLYNHYANQYHCLKRHRDL